MPAIQLYRAPDDDMDIDDSYQISADGTAVAFTKAVDHPLYDLYTVPITGQQPATKHLDTQISQYAFAPEGAALWTTTWHANAYDIAYLPISGNPLTIYRGASHPSDGIFLKSALPEARLLYIRRTLENEIRVYHFEIADTIPAGTLSRGKEWLAEGESTPLTVTLLPSGTVPISYTLTLTGSIDPADVQIEPLTLSIPPGASHAAFTVRHLVDDEEESPLTATLELVPLEGAAVGEAITVTLSFIDGAVKYLPIVQQAP